MKQIILRRQIASWQIILQSYDDNSHELCNEIALAIFPFEINNEALALISKEQAEKKFSEIKKEWNL